MVFNQAKIRQERHTQLKENIQWFEERKPKLMKKWWAYLKLTQKEVGELIVKWDKYYSAVRNTRAYKKYRELKGAFDNSNMERVNVLAKESVKQLEENSFELSKPSSVDPEDLRRYMGRYIAWQGELKGSKVEETKNVFGAEDTQEIKENKHTEKMVKLAEKLF